MKKKYMLLLSAVIVGMVWLLLPAQTNSTNTSSQITLLPLDSRPCNTSYTAYAAQAAGKTLRYPDTGLDHYTRPSDSDALYSFLYNSAPFTDTYIIFTNQLINGGLIASRDPDSYLDLEQKLAEFDTFIRFASENNKRVVVSTVIPRVIPSQFTSLREYSRELILFSQHYGSLELASENDLLMISSIPDDVAASYLSIYQGSDQIVEHVKGLVREGFVDLFVIGQDDTYPQSINNKYLQKYLHYQHPDIIVQPGADELTRLIISRFLREENNWAPLELSLLFTNEELADQTALFEAFSTTTRTSQLMGFLGINPAEENPDGSDKINRAIIHNDPALSGQTLLTLDNHRHADYLGLIDIAYINRGDVQLFENMSLLQHIDGYSGWNTIGNAIGTELANMVVFDFLKRQLLSFPPEKQRFMLENYYKMKYVHFADDYLYQAVLRTNLNAFLAENFENPAAVSDKMLADMWLAGIFATEQAKINQAFTRDYYRFGQTFRITEASASIWLPWERTFEAMISPEIVVELIR